MAESKLIILEADNIRGTIEGCQDEKEKWEMCFDSLLADRQGIELFRKYLENVQDKQGTKLIGMWLIYEGKFIKIIFDIETVTETTHFINW